MDTNRLPQINLPATGPAPDERDWQSLYSAERKRSRILGASTVAASLLAVGVGAWGLTQTDSAGTSGPSQFGGPGSTSQFAPGNGNQFAPPDNGQSGTTDQFAPPGNGQSGTMSGPGQDLTDSLFDSDGSVNTDALQQLLSAMPGGAANLEQFLTMAVQNGQLTSEQADQLLAASTDNSGTQSTDTEDV